MHRVSPRFRRAFVLCALFFFGSLFISCTISPEALQLFLNQAQLQGMITPEQARLIREAAKSFQTESRPFSYEEEYAIGRVVAAAVLSQYPVYDQPELSAYVNRIGQGLAFLSARPLLPRGYHIAILDSDEALAFSAPGGLVLITRGLLRLAGSEDMLAALLAHEVSHAALGHGLVSLASYRMGDLAMYYAALSTQEANADTRETAALFSAAVHDFVSLISVQGYSQTMEFEADAEAIRMLYEAGYTTAALEQYIRVLGSSQDENVKLYSSQHPLPEDRISRLAALERQYEQAAAHVAWLDYARRYSILSRLEGATFDPGYPSACLSALEPSPEMSNNTSGVAPLALIRRERFEKMRRLF